MQQNNINRFIIRVYGIIINENNELLLSDEYEMGMKMTKFPGGGLEFGEGPADCIKREAIEELGQEIEIIEHLYTPDFFQKSMFHDDGQLISIYYKIKCKEDIHFKISDKPFDFQELADGSQSFRWKPLKEINPDDVTFSIDKKVVEMLKGLV